MFCIVLQRLCHCNAGVHLEHVEAVVTIVHPDRGQLEVHLTSPAGTVTRLLAPRVKDKSKQGLTEWPLMSVATWGRPAECARPVAKT